MQIYLDNAATTALDPEVLQAMLPYLTNIHGNPSSTHKFGREARLAIETARKKVKDILNIGKNSELIFTSGGTESNNTTIAAAIRDLGCKHIITSPIEHHAVLHTVEYFEKQKMIGVHYVKLLPDGHIDRTHLEELLKAMPGRTLVTLMHANNEIGTISDIAEIARLCRDHNAIYHADCVQTVGHYPINLQSLAVHFISASGHKFHGPKGTGILYIRDKSSIGPLIHGGGHERNLRAGTENVAGIVGFARALDLANSNFDSDSTHIRSLRNYLQWSFESKVPGVLFNGGYQEDNLYTVLSANFPKNEATEMLLMNLDRDGIAVSGGSACSAGQGSHVMQALGKSGSNITVRFSFSKFSTMAEMDNVAEKLAELLQGKSIVA